MPTQAEVNTWVTDYRNVHSQRTDLNWALVSEKDLQIILTKLQSMQQNGYAVDGIKIYLAKTDVNDMGQKIPAELMIAVPTVNTCDDFPDPNPNDIVCFKIGWSDSIGMCPPKCGTARSI
jgi:hypothetical protein